MPTFHAPPQATVARRAKSYSDFYEAATQYLKKPEKKILSDSSGLLLSEPEQVDIEILFDDCEDELLDASHKEYQCVNLVLSK